MILPAEQNTWLHSKVCWRLKYLMKKQTTPNAQQYGFEGNVQQ